MNLIDNLDEIVEKAGKESPIFDTIEDALSDIKTGKPVIVADDEDRENEGDLIIAADCADEKWINFMVSQCKGLVCVSLSSERAKELGLNPMVEENTDVKKTAFTQSVDADPKFGVTTGISVFDRLRTVKVMLDSKTKPEDLRRPGHLFPIIAKSGGVLERVGHTEASCDLARLAGFRPMALMCEMIKPDGTMARRDDIKTFANEHGIKFITVAQLIKYRLINERFVKRMIHTSLPTKYGNFEIYGYLNELTNVEHVALVKEDKSNKTPMIRMHSECLTGDIFHSLKCDCNSQLHNSLRMIDEYGKGALVYIREHEGRGIGLINKLRAYKLQEEGQDTIEANISLGFKEDLRDYGVGAQILSDLGYKEFNLITNNPKKIVALEGYGLKILERVKVDSEITVYNKKYISTKKEKMEHMI